MRPPYALILGLFTLLATNASAQKEFADWYFSGSNKLSFQNNNIAEFKTDFLTNGTFWWNYKDLGSAGVGYNDPVTGELKFIISDMFTYDKNGDLMLDAPLLRLCPGDKDAIHIIPFQNNPNRFYIIQNHNPAGAILAAQTGLQVRCPNPIGLAYSILDLTLNNGKGGYTEANKVLWGGASSRIAIVRHSNGKDTWILSHPASGGTYNAYLVTDAGIQDPVTSNAGPILNYSFEDVQTTIIVSHDGKKMFGFRDNRLELYDFDPATGKVSNYRDLNLGMYVGGKSFSPDDSKFYFTGGYQNYGLFQLDFDAPDLLGSLTKLFDDKYGMMIDMQLGLDGKIYVSRYYEWDWYQTKDYLSVINCPNLAKYACNLVVKGLYAPRSVGRMPSFINDYGKEPKQTPATEFSIGNDTAMCFGTLTLNAPPGWDHYEWNTGATTRQITVDKPGLYYVLAKNDGFSCPSAYGYINVSNKAKPLDLGKDTLLCPKSTYTIKVPDEFANIKWNDGSTNRIRVVSQSNDYILTASDNNGCNNWDTIKVSIKGEPSANFGNDTTLCNDQTLLLELLPRKNPFQTTDFHKWSDGSTNDTFRVKQNGTYWGEVTYWGCTIRDTINVAYVNTEGVYLGADTTLCEGNALNLKVNIQPATYLWSTGETSADITIATSGTYWVRVNNGACTVTDTIKVNVQPKHNVFLGGDTILCEGSDMLLESNVPGATFKWQDNSTANQYRAVKAGSYWLDANLNGCVVRDSINISYKSSPKLSLGKDTSACSNQPILLDVTDPAIESYLWNDGSINSGLVVSKSGKYSVTATAFNGCTVKDTINVIFSSIPVFNLGNDTAICENATFGLNASVNGAQYEWSNGFTSSSIAVSDAGTYWAQANLNGCIFRDTIMITKKALPQVDLGKDTALCEGSIIVLNAFNENSTYKWTDGSTKSEYTVSKPGQYIVDVNMNGCVQSDVINIVYISKPDISLGEDRSICTGQEYLLTPGYNETYTYKWQNNSTAAAQTITQPGVYSVTASNACGSSFDSVIISKGTCVLILPNAFTPNNDGVNDEFGIKDPGFISTFQMTIFNRWGEVVFKTNNPGQRWDGRRNNQIQPVDTYVWQVTLVTNDGKHESAQGVVNLIR